MTKKMLKIPTGNERWMLGISSNVRAAGMTQSPRKASRRRKYCFPYGVKTSFTFFLFPKRLAPTPIREMMKKDTYMMPVSESLYLSGLPASVNKKVGDK